MGSQTPALALPYPVGTDRVMDGDNAIQALAERIEAVLPRGVIGAWTSLAGTDTATQATIDVFGTVTRTLLAGRQYRVSVSTNVWRQTAGDVSVLILKIDAVDWHQSNLTHSAASSSFPVGFSTYVNGAGAAKTFQVIAFRGSGTGNVSILNNGTSRSSELIIEDMGLVPPALLRRPDASLPDEGDERPDNELPDGPPDRPDNALPEHAAPKAE